MDYNKRAEEIYIREDVLRDYYQVIDEVNPQDDSNILKETVHLYDVKKILDDVGIKENTENGYKKVVIWFDFGFILECVRRGVDMKNIIYIANHEDSEIFARDAGIGKSILLNKRGYKKYKMKKKIGKRKFMKQIPNANEYISVGNIPFTLNDSDSTNSVKIGNDFIILNNLFWKAGYVCQAKFDSTTFKNELITNPKLQKIVFHQKPLFQIATDMKTCHVILNNTQSDTFIYKTNTSQDFVTLKHLPNLALSSDIQNSRYVDTTKKTLGDIWTRGDKSDNPKNISKKLTGTGKYKVIRKVGKKGVPFLTILDETESTSFGKWKVIISNVTGGVAVKIASPEYSISYSVIAFEVKDEASAILLRDYLRKPEVVKMWKGFKRTNANTKSVFDNMELPVEII
jgi:hypothetical protein